MKIAQISSIFLIVSVIGILTTVIFIPKVEAVTTKIYASDDAHTLNASESTRNTNYNNFYLGVTYNYLYEEYTFVKFPLSSLPSNADIQTAKVYMRLGGVDYSDGPIDCKFVSNDGWLESTITWNNQPVQGAILDSKTMGALGWYSWTVTPQVRTEFAGDKTFSVAFVGHPGNLVWIQVTYTSTEWSSGTDGDPYLEVTYNLPSTTTTTSTSTSTTTGPTSTTIPTSTTTPTTTVPSCGSCPGNTCGINCGQTLSGRSPTYREYFTFTLASSQDVTITVTPSPSALYDLIVKWTPSACPSTSVFDCYPGKAAGQAQTCSYSSLPAGTYYIMIDDVIPGTYSLSLSCSGGTTITTTSSSTTTTSGPTSTTTSTSTIYTTTTIPGTSTTSTSATTITSTSTTTTTIVSCSSCPGGACTINCGQTLSGRSPTYREYFTFTLASSQDVTITVTPSSLALYDLIVKWDGSCPSYSNFDCYPGKPTGQPQTCSYTGLPAGTYYIMVDNIIPGTYSLSLSCSDTSATTTIGTTTSTIYTTTTIRPTTTRSGGGGGGGCWNCRAVMWGLTLEQLTPIAILSAILILLAVYVILKFSVKKFVAT